MPAGVIYSDDEIEIREAVIDDLNDYGGQEERMMPEKKEKEGFDGVFIASHVFGESRSTFWINRAEDGGFFVNVKKDDSRLSVKLSPEEASALFVALMRELMKG